MWNANILLQVGYAIIDAAYSGVPNQERDTFWSTIEIDPLYSAETAAIPVNPQIGSVENVVV